MDSQLKFVLNPKDLRCILYQEDIITKTCGSGLRDMRHNRKICWIYPNLSNPSGCPVRLIEKYLNISPKVVKKPNFTCSLSQDRPPLGGMVFK